MIKIQDSSSIISTKKEGIIVKIYLKFGYNY